MTIRFIKSYDCHKMAEPSSEETPSDFYRRVSEQFPDEAHACLSELLWYENGNKSLSLSRSTARGLAYAEKLDTLGEDFDVKIDAFEIIPTWEEEQALFPLDYNGEECTLSGILVAKENHEIVEGYGFEYVSYESKYGIPLFDLKVFYQYIPSTGKYKDGTQASDMCGWLFQLPVYEGVSLEESFNLADSEMESGLEPTKHSKLIVRLAVACAKKWSI